jgi:hypothetical protein
MNCGKYLNVWQVPIYRLMKKIYCENKQNINKKILKNLAIEKVSITNEKYEN